MPMTRRGLQISLGMLWIADGALQLQPAMFTQRFAHDVIAAAGTGQPKPVHWIVMTAAAMIGRAPRFFDAAFAVIQLMLGAALLRRRTVRAGLALSVPWALGVWVVGEGFGGIFGAGSTVLTGAPGAALLYGLLAVAAWPGAQGCAGDCLPARWLPHAWATTWGFFVLLEFLPGRGTTTSIARSLTANLSGLPSGISAMARSLAGLVRHSGSAPFLLLTLVLMLVGLFALRPGVSRLGAGLIGSALAIAIWVLAEGFGGLATGLATDPNSGLLLVLFAIAMCSAAPTRGRPLDQVAPGGTYHAASPASLAA